MFLFVWFLTEEVGGKRKCREGRDGGWNCERKKVSIRVESMLFFCLQGKEKLSFGGLLITLYRPSKEKGK